MDDQGISRAGGGGQLVLWTLVAGIPGTILGFVLVMMWGLSAQAGHEGFWLNLAGIVGFILLLPIMLLGYLVEAVGGLGMTAETILMVVAQFFGYFGLVCGIRQFREHHYQFSLRALLITITTVAIILGLIAWGANF
jgi:hypothetical protein